MCHLCFINACQLKWFYSVFYGLADNTKFLFHIFFIIYINQSRDCLLITLDSLLHPSIYFYQLLILSIELHRHNLIWFGIMMLLFCQSLYIHNFPLFYLLFFNITDSNLSLECNFSHSVALEVLIKLDG
jgi:hypothetical protein